MLIDLATVKCKFLTHNIPNPLNSKNNNKNNNKYNNQSQKEFKVGYQMN